MSVADATTGKGISAYGGAMAMARGTAAKYCVATDGASPVEFVLRCNFLGHKSPGRWMVLCYLLVDTTVGRGLAVTSEPRRCVRPWSVEL
jgi:hypothetical protein